MSKSLCQSLYVVIFDKSTSQINSFKPIKRNYLAPNININESQLLFTVFLTWTLMMVTIMTSDIRQTVLQNATI